jgi:hypothetical protein
MVSNRTIFSTLIIYLLSNSVFAFKVDLPELLTKSEIRNIRYLSKDGSITYYQRRSGNLLLSTNYKVSEVISSKMGSQYQIQSTSSEKNLIVSVDESFHTFFSVRHLKKLYVLPYGKKNATELGWGLAPRLHLNDSWVSYYNPYKSALVFKNLMTTALEFSISVKSELNPFFIPQVVMLDDKTILYTDVNNKGIHGILKYDRALNSIKPVFKSAYSSQKIEICLGYEHLFIGEFGINDNDSGSIIAKVNLKTFDIDKADVIYQSKNNDFGNIKCHFKKEFLYFIKNISKVGGRIESDVISFHHKKKIVKRLSKLKYVSQLISMGEKLLIPYRGKYYVLLGNKDMTTADLLKSTTGDDNTGVEKK